MHLDSSPDYRAPLSHLKRARTVSVAPTRTHRVSLSTTIGMSRRNREHPLGPAEDFHSAYALAQRGLSDAMKSRKILLALDPEIAAARLSIATRRIQALARRPAGSALASVSRPAGTTATTAAPYARDERCRRYRNAVGTPGGSAMHASTGGINDGSIGYFAAWLPRWLAKSRRRLVHLLRDELRGNHRVHGGRYRGKLRQSRGTIGYRTLCCLSKCPEARSSVEHAPLSPNNQDDTPDARG